MNEHNSTENGTAAATLELSPITGKPVPSAQAHAEAVALDLLKIAFATLSPAGQDEVLRRLRASA